MEVEDLIQTVLGTGVIYLFVDRMKVHLPESAHVWIPELCALLGVALICAALYMSGPHRDELWLLGVLRGIAIGYAATGIHAAKKQRVT